MAKSERLKEYDDSQWKKREEFEERFEDFKNELYSDREIKDIEPEEFVEIQNKLKNFVNKEHPERGYYIKYDNFIMDIRKPSFGCFLIFIVLSVIGLITVIRFIF